MCCHGVPSEHLSDRGANLLISLVFDVCKLLGMRTLNTTVYHPQGDGLVDNFNRFSPLRLYNTRMTKSNSKLFSSYD